MFRFPPPRWACQAACLIGLLSFTLSCDKDEPLVETANLPEVTTVTPLEITPPKVEHGMFVFETREDFDRTLNLLKLLPFTNFEAWEERHGVQTIYGEFNRIILAEDAIDNHFRSLPEDEQEYHRNQPQVFSDEYKAGLKEKIIKLVPDEDGAYFEYATVEPAYAPVLNKYGLVKVSGKVYQHTDEVSKIIMDGDFHKVASLDAIDESNRIKAVVVVPRSKIDLKKNASEDWSKLLTNRDDITWDIWKDKRWRVWVDGRSQLTALVSLDDCAQQVSCTFQIRSQAQRKNFWGKWKYTNWSPQLELDNTWTYTFSRYNDGLCGSNVSEFSSVAPYNCTGGPNNCPTSPYSAVFPNTNNGFFSQTPHGLWEASGPLWPDGLGYFSDAIDVTGTLDATYHGTSWDINY
jgi:hypothetical protein